MIRLNSNLTYTFTGSGSWTVTSNWSIGVILSGILHTGSSITINPPVTGICYLNTIQHVATSASLTRKSRQANGGNWKFDFAVRISFPYKMI